MVRLIAFDKERHETLTEVINRYLTGAIEIN